MKVGWKTKTLGDVCHVYQPETITQKQMVAGDFRVYGANGQIGWHNRFNHEKPQLILGCRGSCGTVHVTESQSWINGNAMVVQPTNGAMDISFLAYALKGGIELSSAITGAAQPQITRTSLMPIAITFPESLPEQHRIVAILDEAFDGIATAKANAEKNLQNARALFESHLQSVFKEKRNGWTNSRLGEICVFSQGIQVDVKQQTESKHSDGQVRFLRIVDFTQGSEPPRYIDNPGPKFIVSASDIALVRYGASTGFVCSGLDGAIANNLFRVIPNSTLLTAEYLLWFLRSPLFQDEIRRKMNGAAMPAISFGMINNIDFPLPPFSDQATLVGVLNELTREVRHLESLYQQKLTALDDLKKSLLHQAFSGQL
jgi:type I restriction enzyme, S subunit